MRGRLRHLAIVWAVLAAAVVMVSPVNAQQEPPPDDGPTDWPGVIAFGGPGSFALGWTTPRLVVPQGVPITLMVVDAQPHNFVALGVYGSDDNFWCDLMNSSPGSCPRFWSELIFGPQAATRPEGQGLGEVFTPVYGLEDLEPGDYPFYCSVHASFMQGILTIV